MSLSRCSRHLLSLKTKFAVDSSDKKVQYDPDYIHLSIAYSSLILLAKVCVFTTSNPKSPVKNQRITVITQKFTSTRSHLILFFMWCFHVFPDFTRGIDPKSIPSPNAHVSGAQEMCEAIQHEVPQKQTGALADEICKNSLP